MSLSAMATYLIFFAVLIGVSWAQLNEVMEQLRKIANDSKRGCEENGGPEAFANLVIAQQEYGQCIDNVSASLQQPKIEEYSDMVKVFKQFCEKERLYMACFNDLSKTVNACLSQKKKVVLKTTFNVAEQLADYICFKEGDRIALLIEEGGLECVKENLKEIGECTTKTLGAALKTKITLAALSFDEKECQKIYDLQNCAVKVLETCPKPTAANIMESIFKFVRNVSPCKNFANDSAERIFVTSLTLVTASAVTLLL